MVKVPLYLEAGRQWLAENALPPPPLEMREFRPFDDEHAGVQIIVCHHCGKGNPENVFCDCPAGRAVAASFDAAHRRPDRIPVPADFPVRPAQHVFSTLSDRCILCYGSRARAVDLGNDLCFGDLASAMDSAVDRKDWDRVGEIRAEALRRSEKPIRKQMERKAAALFNSVVAPDSVGGFDEKMFEDACERLVGELVRLPNGYIGSRRELNAYFDDFKARHRAEMRQANGDAIAAPVIALMERQGTALAAAFAVPVVPTIETLSASPPACKLLPDS